MSPFVCTSVRFAALNSMKCFVFSLHSRGRVHCRTEDLEQIRHKAGDLSIIKPPAEGSEPNERVVYFRFMFYVRWIQLQCERVRRLRGNRRMSHALASPLIGRCELPASIRTHLIESTSAGLQHWSLSDLHCFLRDLIILHEMRPTWVEQRC